MTSKLTRLLVGAAMGAGAIGVIMAVAGVHSPVRTALVLLFLAVAPTAAIAGLMGNFDPFARLILSVVSTIAVLSIVGMILLAAGLWSPIGELLVVAAITVVCLVAQLPSVRARVAGWTKSRRPAAAEAETAAAEAGTADAAAGTADAEAEVAGIAAAGAGTADATAVAAGNGHAETGNVRIIGRGQVAGNGQAAENGQIAGNGHATPHATEAEAPATSPGEADTVVLPAVGQAEQDTAESTAQAGTGGPAEVTAPLPAIRD